MITRIALMVLLLLAFSMGGALAEGPTLAVLPSKESVDAGELITVDIFVDSQVGVYAAQYELVFDPAVFEVFSQSAGDFLKSDGQSAQVVANSYNNTEGRATYGETRVGTSTGITGKGILATMLIKVRDDAKQGAYEISFVRDNTVLGDITATAIPNVSLVPATIVVNAASQPESTSVGGETSSVGISSQPKPSPTETPTATPKATETPVETQKVQTTPSAPVKLPSPPETPIEVPAPSVLLAILALFVSFLMARRV